MKRPQCFESKYGLGLRPSYASNNNNNINNNNYKNINKKEIDKSMDRTYQDFLLEI
jgi:hypothetical protein